MYNDTHVLVFSKTRWHGNDFNTGKTAAWRCFQTSALLGAMAANSELLSQCAKTMCGSLAATSARSTRAESIPVRHDWVLVLNVKRRMTRVWGDLLLQSFAMISPKSNHWCVVIWAVRDKTVIVFTILSSYFSHPSTTTSLNFVRVRKYDDIVSSLGYLRFIMYRCAPILCCPFLCCWTCF